jgi:hypothetical protein
MLCEFFDCTPSIMTVCAGCEETFYPFQSVLFNAVIVKLGE